MERGKRSGETAPHSTQEITRKTHTHTDSHHAEKGASGAVRATTPRSLIREAPRTRHKQDRTSETDWRRQRDGHKATVQCESEEMAKHNACQGTSRSGRGEVKGKEKEHRRRSPWDCVCADLAPDVGCEQARRPTTSSTTTGIADTLFETKEAELGFVREE